MRFFAGIKGCPAEEIPGEVDRLVRSVGLTEKRDVQARFLSGGQKRKLSVAIAFIGDSKIVILGSLPYEGVRGRDVGVIASC